MKPTQFDKFWNDNMSDLTKLITTLKTYINNDCRASNNPEDNDPGIQITISINEACSEWSYQTEDNSYIGGCYGHPYWGVSYLYHDTSIDELVLELISDLGEQITFEPDSENTIDL